MSAQPKLMKRRSIWKAELFDICARQGVSAYWGGGQPVLKAELIESLREEGRCECGCDRRFKNVQMEFEHTIPNAMLYEGDEIDWTVYREDCHLLKTKIDVARIAKAKRMAGETGQQARRKRRDKPLIQSRGFSKNLTRGFDGKVRERK